MAPTVIIIRTDYVDRTLIDWADTLHADTGLEVVFAADEQKNNLDFPDRFVKLSVTSPSVQQLGLTVTPDFAWRCGDYCFYLAHEHFRDASFFWLIEPDVFLNFSNYLKFFCPFEAEVDVDFIAPGYRKAETSWMWGTFMEPVQTPVYACLFPIVRLSAQAVRVTYASRRKIADKYKDKHSFDQFPNDESFVATTLTHAGLVCRNLNDFNRKLYAYGTTFVNGRVLSAKKLQTMPNDNLVYHPVRSGMSFEKKMRGYIANARSERQITQVIAALEDIEAEMGPHERDHARQSVNLAHQSEG